MTLVLTSTTDSPEAVTAAMGDLAKGNVQPETKQETTTESVEAQSENEVAEEVTEGQADESAEVEASDTDENEIEELEASGEDEVSEDQPLEQKPKKKQNGFKKRISKLTNERDYWRDVALRNQSQAQPQETQKPEPQVEAKPDLATRPKAEDFENHDDYVIALSKWSYAEEKRNDERKSREQSAKTEWQSKIKAHNERVQKFAEEHDDFNQVVNSVRVPMPVAIQQAIVESEASAQLMYSLSKDQKELQRICQLPLVSALKELGKLEAKLTPQAPNSSVKKTTMAPKPVNPVRTKGSVVTKSLSDPDLPFKDFERMRNEQRKSARG